MFVHQHARPHFPPFLFPTLPSSIPSRPLILYPFPLKEGPKIELDGLGSAVSSIDGVWGGAPAEIEFGTFYPYNLTSGCNKFEDFPENHMTTFHTEFPKSMQNFETCEYVAKHWIVIASKTGTEQYGSSILFYSRWVISQCRFLSVHTALCGVVEHWQLRVWSHIWGVMLNRYGESVQPYRTPLNTAWKYARHRRGLYFLPTLQWIML